MRDRQNQNSKPSSTDLASSAIFGPSLELDESVKGVGLALERVGGVETGRVIVEGDKVLVTLARAHGHLNEIAVHQIENPGRDGVGAPERVRVHLASETC